jgi:long-chain acyl-CoA synthetase
LIEAPRHEFGPQTAFTCCLPNGMNGALTFEALGAASDAFAAWLRECAGVAAGDRVAVQMPNCLAFPVAAFGVVKAGAVLVNTNPLYTADEMTKQFRDAGIKVLVIIDMFADKLPAVTAAVGIEHVVVVKLTEFFPGAVGSVVRLIQKYWSRQLPEIEVPHVLFADVLREGREALEARPSDTVAGYTANIGLHDIAALQYTGGTTGVAKGAMLTHANLMSNMAMVFEFSQERIERGREVVLTALPLYHILAFTANLLCFYTAGAHNVLIPSPRPLSNLKRAFENYRITWMTGVNTLFNGLCNEHWFQEYPPKHLKAAVAGGMALHSAVAERWRKLVGSPVVEGYGLTESSPVLTFNPFERSKPESIGIPMPSTELRCIDENGNEVPVGTAGEIAARGPQVMKGYWNKPEETAQVLKNGWLLTGDIGVMDEEGYFRIVDRKKDMILASGFNVYPNELEDCIAKLEGVLEVAVIGVPDGERGEAAKAFVVRKDPALTTDAVRAHCKQHLTGYKVPKLIEFRDDLPKSPVGKILRKDLRQIEAQTRQQAPARSTAEV